MKTTLMQIEGENGRATIGRKTTTHPIVAEVWYKTKAGEGRQAHLVANGRDAEDQGAMAAALHVFLDGYRGTNGDIADYQRAVELLAD